ncbi:MAG: hypothetical protein AB7R89_23415 [Dehalococcoidia bacterium]
MLRTHPVIVGLLLAVLFISLITACGESEQSSQSTTAPSSAQPHAQQTTPAATQAAQQKPQLTESPTVEVSLPSEAERWSGSSGDYAIEIVYKRLEPKLQRDAVATIQASEGYFLVVILRITGESCLRDVCPGFWISRIRLNTYNSKRDDIEYRVSLDAQADLERNWYPRLNTRNTLEVRPGSSVEFPLIFNVRYSDSRFELNYPDSWVIRVPDVPVGKGIISRDNPLRR